MVIINANGFYQFIFHITFFPLHSFQFQLRYTDVEFIGMRQAGNLYSIYLPPIKRNYPNNTLIHID